MISGFYIVVVIFKQVCILKIVRRLSVKKYQRKINSRKLVKGSEYKLSSLIYKIVEKVYERFRFSKFAARCRIELNWYKIPRDQYDINYESSFFDQIKLSNPERKIYDENLMLRREICQDQNSYRFYNRQWKTDCKNNVPKEKRARSKEMALLYKRSAYQKRKLLWSSIPFRTIGWLITETEPLT